MKKIPHIIHYCWFGKSPKTRETERYIRGWKKKLPGYTFMEWNEERFPVSEYPFAQKAFKEGRYAFVSDVARIFALNEYGGIYLDTDIEVIKDFSECLDGAEMVLGNETEDHLMTAFIAAVPHHPVIEEMLEYYQEHEFAPVNGSYAALANPKILTPLVRKRGYEGISGIQKLSDGIIVCPEEYFSAYELRVEKSLRTENTYTIHHFSGSWMPFSVRFHKLCKKILRRLFGDKLLRRLLQDKGEKNIR